MNVFERFLESLHKIGIIVNIYGCNRIFEREKKKRKRKKEKRKEKNERKNKRKKKKVHADEQKLFSNQTKYSVFLPSKYICPPTQLKRCKTEKNVWIA